MRKDENIPMAKKPTYKDLEKKLEQLEKEAFDLEKTQKLLRKAYAELDQTALQMEVAIERSNRMATEAEITNLEFSQILNTVTDGIWVIDKNYDILRINKAILDIVQKTENEVIGKKCYDILQSSLCNSPKCPMKKILKKKKPLELDMEKLIDGKKPHQFLLAAAPFLGLEGRAIGILEILKDISIRKRMEEELHKVNQELKRLTVVDGLTKIPNRRHFDNSLEIEWRRMIREKKPLSLIFCDVDHFKLYNDTKGHQAGDDCLRSVALQIKKNVKRSTDIVARYGGEEFSVILPDTDAKGALCVAERIRHGIKDLKISHPSSPVNRYLTLSLGVSMVVPRSNDLSPDMFIDTADRALYIAKKEGRNRSSLILCKP